MLNQTPTTMPSSSSSSTAPVIEAGVYPAIISLIVDLGVQKNKIFESMNKSDEECTPDDYDISPQIWFSFTLPTERYEVETDDGTVLRDQILGKMFKVSKSDKSNLIKMYQAVVKDGRSFGEMIGMPVTITTGMTSGGKPKVMSVAAAMRGSSVDAPLRDPMVVGEDSYNNLDSLDIPDFIKDMINNRVQ